MEEVEAEVEEAEEAREEVEEILGIQVQETATGIQEITITETDVFGALGEGI